LVTEAPRGTYLLIDGRRLDPGNQFVPVKEGSELTLECAAEGGNPPPVLVWGMTLSQATLDGPEQPPDNLTVLPSTSGGRSGAHLKVLRGHHNATIVCVARHITLMMPMNASILLDVQWNNSEINISLIKTSRSELEVKFSSELSSLKINREAKFCRLFTLVYGREKYLF
ncbi:hypothetical protein EAG_10248, partial [Camponotus floridanus]